MKNKKTLLFSAIIFILVGTLLTLENFSVIAGISAHWPIFLLIIGSGFTILYFQRKKTDEVLLWLGTLIFILGIFSYYLNFTSWQQLATLWPIFLGIIGSCFLSVGLVAKKVILNYFGILFISLFLIFTLVFTISIKLWPLSLVVFGICLLILEYLHNKIKI